MPDLLKALAIVNIFETGMAFGDFAACVVLNDGAGISYGISQFTHRSGSLAAVAERYLENGGTVGRQILEGALPMLRRTEPAIVRSVSANDRLKKTLLGASVTREMREAQLHVALTRYLTPAIDACKGSGFVLPLSLAVIYDSITHGSYEKIRDRVKAALLDDATGEREAGALDPAAEKAWITEYLRRRDAWLASIARLNATRYRTRFFLDQIALGKWELALPMNVNGHRLTDADLEKLSRYTEEDLMAVGPHTLPESSPREQSPLHDAPYTHPSNPQGQPPPFARTEKRVGEIGEAFDRIESAAKAITSRTDRAKSLWATVIGTIWQSIWALFGFIAGLPQEVWFVVAVIAGLLTLFYLYRQFSLGKLRERTTIERIQ